MLYFGIMDTEEIISNVRAESEEELYSKLNQARNLTDPLVQTKLPGDTYISSTGLLNYDGEVQMTAVIGDITVARDEITGTYWFTEGDTSYWLNDDDGKVEPGENHRVEQLHRIGNQILEPVREQEKQKNELRIEGQQPGLFTSGPLQYIPNARRDELRREIESADEIDMREYAKGLNEDPYETAESMARELSGKLRRTSNFDERDREGTVLR